jgi:acyl dehydratase
VRYFEDFPAGLEIELGSVTLSTDEIIAFGRTYDPQPMHIDPAAAGESLFGGLIASGWQTASSFMRLLVDTVLFDSASLGSPGIDKLRWLQPVRPGETLHGRFTVLEARASRSRPDRGIVRGRGEMRTAAGEVVMDMESISLFSRRQPRAAWDTDEDGVDARAAAAPSEAGGAPS